MYRSLEDPAILYFTKGIVVDRIAPFLHVVTSFQLWLMKKIT